MFVIGQVPLAVGSAGLGEVVAQVHSALPAACLRAHVHTTRTHSGAAGRQRVHQAAGSARRQARATHTVPLLTHWFWKKPANMA